MVNRLLIVDDHAGFRTFVATLLGGDEFTVAGVAEDGESALTAIDDLVPDLVLLDIQLPGLDGFQVAERIATKEPHPLVVLTSTRDAADFGVRLTNAPVLGFVPKHEMSVAAIKALLDKGQLDSAVA